MKIEELDFTVRTYHALKRAGINTTEELAGKTDDDLYKLRNIGKLTVAEIRSKLPYIPPEKIMLQPARTNADRIRTMSLEDLGRFLCGLMNLDDCDARCPAREFCYPGHNGMKDYLNAPERRTDHG